MREKILDVNIDFGYNIESASLKILEFIKDKKSGLISTTNPYFIISAGKDPEFKNIINNSLLSLPDGVGVLYAKYYLEKVKKLNKKNILFPLKAFTIGLYCGISSYFDKNFGYTVTGVDLVYKLCEIAAENNLTVFFLGGRLRNVKGRLMDNKFDMATKTSEEIKRRYPKIKIIGSTSQFSRDIHDDKKTIEYIKNCMFNNKVNHIDILFVAYNPINQEKWIQRNAKKIPAMISIGVGRTYDYITDTMRPPDKIYDKLHIAWLYAFIKQPWRIKRVFKTIIIFPAKIFLAAINK